MRAKRDRIGSGSDPAAVGRHGKLASAATLAAVLIAAPVLAHISFETRVDVDAPRAPTSLAVWPEGDRVAVGGDQGVSVLRRMRETLSLAYENTKALRFVKAVEVADFNGDGWPDVACIDGQSASLIILPGAEDGFGPRTLVPLPTTPRALRAYVQGSQSLLFAAGADACLRIERGADEVLRARPVFVAAAGDFEVADLDGDAVPEVILVERSENRLRVLSASGEGYAVAAELSGIQQPQRAAAADVDGDRRPDLLVIAASGLTLLTQSGPPGLAFAPPRWLWSSRQLTDVAAADVDGDGDVDVAVLDRGRACATFLVNDGEAKFALGASYSTGRGPRRLRLADVSGDANLDAIVANEVSDSVTVLRGIGGGRFRGVLSLLADASSLDAGTAGDVNGDGHLDLIVLSNRSANANVFTGSGDGRFRALPPILLGGQPRAIVVGQLTADDLPDLAISDYAADSVFILPGDGQGNFAGRRQIAVGRGPTAMVAASFGTGDRPDLAVVNTLGNTVSVLYRDDDGELRGSEPIPVIPRPTFLMAGDTDHDQHTDLVVGSDQTSTVSVLASNGRTLSLARTDDLADTARPLLAEDLDQDGLLDLVVQNESEDAIDVLPGTGNGQFGLPLTFAVGWHPTAVVAGDFDEDGLADIAVIHRDTATVSILRNTSHRHPLAPTLPPGAPERKPRRSR